MRRPSRGDTVFAVCINALALIDGGAKFIAERFDISEEDKPWFQRDAAKLLPAEFFDAVLMRLEPPINAAFMEATLFLDHVAVPVFNAPRALRELNEKLAILRFPEWIPPTVVSADFQTLSDFHRQHGGAVIKPLDGMGGRGVVVSPVGDKNLRALIELVGDGGRMLMAQQYLDKARAVIVGCLLLTENRRTRCLSAFRVMTTIAATWPPVAAPRRVLWASKKDHRRCHRPDAGGTRYSFCRLGHYRRQTYGNQYHLSDRPERSPRPKRKDLAEDILQSLEVLIRKV